jgi:2-polyprenyl-3-methyl-5-hydroxy-6-metoxy-1,4-benzoquinol methylase
VGEGPACQVCGAAERRHFIHHQGMDLYECSACGLVYLDPMPSAAESRALYADAYQGATSGYFAKVGAKLRRSRGRVRQLARRLPKGAGGRFLDVGCSGGFMVEAAREAGFEAWGLDLDPVSIAYAREHYPQNQFFDGPLEDFAPGAPFDAVYCSEVIEHLGNANAFAAALATLMAPGAVLYLTTPDLGHWRRPKDLTTWDAFCPPAHMLYFNRQNLTRLLANHGLEVIARRFAWKPGLKLFVRRR